MTDVDAPAADPSAAPEAPPAPEELHGAPVTRLRGFRVVHPSREQLVGLVRTLRDEGWVQCLDLCGVDYLAHRRSDLPDGVNPERFEVVVTLISHELRERLRLRRCSRSIREPKPWSARSSTCSGCASTVTPTSPGS
jgi:NADH:ubiquinone oxidoreductase subunit C